MEPMNGVALDGEGDIDGHDDGLGDGVVNGSASHNHDSNGKASSSTFRREELVRLMLQSLHSLGMEKSVRQLQEESGFLMETPLVSKFRTGILEGNWDVVRLLLPIPCSWFLVHFLEERN